MPHIGCRFPGALARHLHSACGMAVRHAQEQEEHLHKLQTNQAPTYTVLWQAVYWSPQQDSC